MDSDSGVLKSAKLGILGGAQVQNTSTLDPSRTESLRFASTTDSLATALGSTLSPAATTINVDGQLDRGGLRHRYPGDAQGPEHRRGRHAEIIQETVAGKTLSRLSVGGTVTADAGASDPAASQRAIELLGFVRNASASEITAGSDAKLRIDGYAMTRRTNVVTDAIEGVTLDLLASDAASRTSSVTAAGLGVVTDPKTIDAGTYEISVADGGSGVIASATIGGVAADWDPATRTIRGRTGTAFEGLELGYTGAVTNGRVDDLVVAGDISVDLAIS